MNLWEENDDFLARWLNDDLSPEEKAEFENSAEGKAYAQMIQAADKLQPPAYDVEAGLHKFKMRIASVSETKETKTIWMRPAFRYAVAACVTAILVATYVFLQSPLTEINTLPGGQQLVTLPDGSEVKMNGGSTIAFNEKTWAEDRSVTISGEGFFQVKKGSSFVVKTDLGSVTVLGTSFNVRTRNDKLEVVCYTGKVNVASTYTDENLLPGDGLRVEKGSITKSWKNSGVGQEPSWLQGLTLFEDAVPLKEVIDELVNVFGIQVLENELPDTAMFKGPFLHNNAANAIREVLFPSTDKFRYEFDSSNNTLSILEKNP